MLLRDLHIFNFPPSFLTKHHFPFIGKIPNCVRWFPIPFHFPNLIPQRIAYFLCKICVAHFVSEFWLKKKGLVYIHLHESTCEAFMNLFFGFREHRRRQSAFWVFLPYTNWLIPSDSDTFVTHGSTKYWNQKCIPI